MSEQAKPHCPISVLADSDLDEILKRLPPYERLIISEVCHCWNRISRRPWIDIKTLDLSPIPGKYIGAIVKQCPNLQAVFAVRKCFGSRDLTCLAGAPSLSFVKFHACEFTLAAIEPHATHDVFKTLFSTNQLEHTSWTELSLHDASFRVSHGSVAKWAFSARFLPASLTRLQVSGLWSSTENPDSYDDDMFLEGLERLENLETFLCHGGCKHGGGGMISGFEAYDFMRDDGVFTGTSNVYAYFARLCALTNLQELCIEQACLCEDEIRLSRFNAILPRLRVLFLNGILLDWAEVGLVKEDLNELITKNSVLRILVITGEFNMLDDVFDDAIEPIKLAARKRFPLGFGSEPLPLLHIFIGKAASEKIRFSKSDAAIVHPINAPMPEFLEREDIASIFEGAWLAEKIREAAKHGGELWDYEKYDTASSVQYC